MSVRSEERLLLGALLPERVHWAEETGAADGEPLPPWLFAEEEALMARATPGRRCEFATARLCAHRALAALGVTAAPLLRGRRGAPAWPAGTVGSITHCAGYRGAAVASATRFLGLGIDAEPHAPLPSGVREEVVCGPEEARLRELAARRPDIAWDRLLFSAKESVYKAWSGYGGAWLGFEDAEVSWRLDAPDSPHPPALARDVRSRPPARARDDRLHPSVLARDDFLHPSARSRDDRLHPSARTRDDLAHTPSPAHDDRPYPAPRVRTEFPRASGRFRARLLVPPPEGPCPLPRVLPGRWLVREGLLLTAVAVPRPVPLPPHRTALKEYR
ncbi:4'-phosphopantetheinyl transferase [Streptomyces sp. TLI_105]|uniref:4'-phosphopantetheinyl transferase family protein n=1 Tax=Streptomyces sp. TLI_105 TaxID=1881019 RepID=UPI000895231C|nr:4'-phosphopantetheinyl transferase superfamily protein [Streptomyces sp. TLI_105]SEC24489.1 4'-phosphopantetheinyl transferase EntD (siderophore biosynthesis) [Streptomyces sp. TLI_105]